MVILRYSPFMGSGHILLLPYERNHICSSPYDMATTDHTGVKAPRLSNGAVRFSNLTLASRKQSRLCGVEGNCATELSARHEPAASIHRTCHRLARRGKSRCRRQRTRRERRFGGQDRLRESGKERQHAEKTTERVVKVPINLVTTVPHRVARFHPPASLSLPLH